MAKKIPVRQCVGCGEMKNKRDMLRILKTPEDNIVLDVTGKQNGRGAYICKDRNCFEKARTSKGLERSLKRAVSKEIYDSLLKEFENLDDKET